MIYITPKQLSGIFAKCAVQQSPYPVPAKFKTAMHDFMCGFDKEKPVLDFCCDASLRSAVHRAVYGSVAIRAWNERKNGRPGFEFVSAFSATPPDDDFIDLDALVGNIVCSVMEDQDQQHPTPVEEQTK